MSESEPTTVEAVVEALERYLEARPLAADTLDGIATWWLTSATRHASLDQVAAAVERLCRRGLLLAERQKSGVIVYRVAPQRGESARPEAGQ